jgi:ATP-dependent Lhr-like helicase
LGDNERGVLAASLLHRFGIVGRDTISTAGVRGGFAALYRTLTNAELAGNAHRGHFVDSGGGMQFAAKAAPDLLRHAAAADTSDPLVLHTSDPALPFAEQSWPAPGAPRGGWVALQRGAPVWALDASGRRLQRFVPAPDVAHPVADTEEPDEALAALLDHVLRPGRLRRVIIDTSDPELSEALRRHRFVDTPKGLTRHARG